MEVSTFFAIRERLQDKRDALQQWFTSSDPGQRKMHLGTAQEGQFTEHLAVIDESIARAEAHTLGLCKVCHEQIGRRHLEMDYTATVCIDHFSTEEIRQLERELELAQSVQRALLPQQAPQLPGLEYAAFSRPAQIVGGDFFDFLQFGDGSYGLAIADVSGHGMSAGMLMASLQTALRTLAPVSHSPLAVVQQLHHIYQHNLNLPFFVTLFVGRFDLMEGRFSYCNAGHNPPLALRPDGSSTWLDSTGPAIGLVEHAEYCEGGLPLWPGEALVFYTDGITEAADPQRQMFGEERLLRAAAENRQHDARQIVAALRQQVETHVAGRPLEDDVTIVVCKIGA